MRNLFLALLLINLLVWAGFSWFGPPERVIGRYDGPGITLVREVEAAAESGLRLGEPVASRDGDARAGAGGASAGSEFDLAPGGDVTDSVDPDDTGRDGVGAGVADDGSLAPDGLAAGASDALGSPGGDDPGAGDGSDVADAAGSADGAAADDGVAASAAVDSAAAAANPPQRCLAVGPFVEPADADAARARLVDDGLSARRVETEEEIWEGYMVYLGGIASNEDAREILEHLEVNGVEDTQLISGDSGLLISLGIYLGLTRAGTRAEQVSRLGYEATVAERTRFAEVSWLEVTLDADESFEIDPLRPPGRISRLELRACTSSP